MGRNRGGGKRRGEKISYRHREDQQEPGGTKGVRGTPSPEEERVVGVLGESCWVLGLNEDP